ncbi:endolytic transglycosylase MltG [bacterium 210820-DFI.6.37]|nr:endolytic transglycosylase MltG [bacterium 210820-DFI.6.37]
MNRIKDFFYNKNDVIVALIILAAAAFIIYLRIGDIMSYPETLADSSVIDQSTLESTSESSATVSVTIPEDPDAEAVSKMLAEAGVVSSASEFQAALKKYKLAGSIQSGTVQIPDGASTEEIIELITGQKPQQETETTKSTSKAAEKTTEATE